MSSNYSNEVAKQAVSRACLALNIKSVKEEAVLELIADVLSNSITKIGTYSKKISEQGGRSIVGLHDVLHALNSDPSFNIDWRSLREFALDPSLGEGNNADGNNNEMNSINKWNQSFPFEIPAYPCDAGTATWALPHLEVDSAESLSANGTLVIGAQGWLHDSRKHNTESNIPPHLPPLPSIHTYRRTNPRKRSTIEDTTNNNINAVKRSHEEASVFSPPDEDSLQLSQEKQRQRQSEIVRAAKNSLALIENSVDKSL